MQKVINTHCHIYPNKIASKAVDGIRDFYDLEMSLNGTVDDLIKDGSRVGCVHYIVHSVATTPKQVKSINEFIGAEVKARPDLLTGFGTLHPDSDDIEGDLDLILEFGFKGVKIHPDFQQFALNEEKAIKMGKAVCDRGLPMMIHCGDFRYDYSNPKHLKQFLEEFPDMPVVGAHFAGWSMWEKATLELAGTPNLYFDTSSSLYALDPETATAIIRLHGAERVLWATDYPMWDSVKEMERFNKLDLTEEERHMILYANAAKQIGLKD